MNIIDIGAVAFGAVVGYVTYRTLMRSVHKTSISDLAAVIGAIGGGAVTKLYDPTNVSFAYYSIGLASGFLLFFVLFWVLNGKTRLAKVMSGNIEELGGGNPRPEPVRKSPEADARLSP
jgi:hypothetical protein